MCIIHCALAELLHAGDVLADDVELDIDDTALLDIFEVGFLVGVWDDADTDITFAVHDVGFADSEAYAVDANRALVHSEIAAAYHIQTAVVFEAIIPTAVGFLHIDTACGLIDMPLDDMPVETLVEEHRAFDIDPVSLSEQPEVTALERLLHSGYGIEVSLDLHHREADTVVGDRLVDRERFMEWIAQRKMLIALFLLHPDDLRHGFYDS